MRKPSLHGFMEYKGVVRRVRTPSGAEKYGQPIGSIIVRDVMPEGLGKIRDRAATLAGRDLTTDMAPASAGPQKAVSEYEGWDKWKIGRTSYYVGKEDGKWVVHDKDDNVLFEGPTKTSARKHIDSLVPAPKPTRATTAKAPATPRKQLAKLHNATEEERKNFVANGGRIPIPPAWTNVRIADDLSTARLQATGKDAKGRSQSIYSAEHTEGQAEAKYARMKAMMKQIDKLDNYLATHAVENDDAAALLFMRELGMRPDTGTKGAEYQSYGALTLEKRHVSVTNGGKTTFSFRPGKKKGPDYIEENGKQVKNPATWVTMTTTNPLVADVVRARLDKLNGLRGHHPILNTNSGRVNKMLKEALGGDEFKAKDLRTMKANVMALEIISKRKRPALPRTMTEYKKWRNAVGDEVAAALGNTRTMALNSYINPVVFAKWEAAVS